MVRPLRNLAEVAVIGGGLAGLSAALHAARLGRLVTLFEGSGLYGGLVATVDQVDGLGVPGHLSGQALAMHLLEQARKIGVQVVEWPVAHPRPGPFCAFGYNDRPHSRWRLPHQRFVGL